MAKWWQNEKKGMPVAVATPVVQQEQPPQQAQQQQQQQYYEQPQPHYQQAQQQPSQVPYNIMRGGTMPMTAPEDLYHRMGARSSAHKSLLLVNLIAGLTCVNNAIAQTLALTYKGNLHMEVVLRIYLIGLCILAAINESERVPMVRDSPILNNWIARGVFYSFLGVLAQNLYDVGYDNRYRRNRYNAYSNNNNNSGYGRTGDYGGYYGPRMPSKEDYCEWYIWMTSLCMFLIGMLYIVLGALCLQNKLRQLRAEYQQRQEYHNGGAPAKEGVMVSTSSPRGGGSKKSSWWGGAGKV